ncbi:energy-coupling factor ABC transporter ATP-binding protein [Phaeovulum vinaykumarii]|uniref:Cobalt/nickel transport system ATP-binding protein n=1 Tax=Phaeovulum vinaykumarii TaxID=407234 RepID=A0A1N7MIC1_9RHOB|nr:ABC transporter ATP-binding protein [Phaeovulum vinaykumarii]SIS85875.1 cobalt/nickel transport system ATP-binding protein [Phaeovulum vinaykumarii]SOC12407.1 cobalt/nickel transport system ATP-binding protein [Phaeovulum vinaykumarii]
MSPVLELAGIHFAYPGRPAVLTGASLRVGAGDRIALVGPNGSGKSTLLRIAVGLLRPSAGQVTGFGRPRVTETDFQDLRRDVGLVFQDPDDQLFCPTVIEDVAFGPRNLGQGRAEALATSETVLREMDLMHLRDRVTHHLSGGEKRLVTLATVLAMRPRVLLLDEPTNALDPENAARLLAILRGLDQALVMVSHDAAFRAQLDLREVHLRAGRLAESP